MEATKSREADNRGHYYREQMRRHGKRYKEFHPPSAMLVFDLIYTYDVTANRLARNVNKLDLSLSAFNLLMILLRRENKACPLHELSKLLLVSRANITGLVDCLEARGLVSRKLDDNDRRVRLAHLTPAGEQLLESFLPEHYQKVRQLCSGLSDEEKATLSDLLTKLRHSITEHAVEPSGQEKAKR